MKTLRLFQRVLAGVAIAAFVAAFAGCAHSQPQGGTTTYVETWTGTTTHVTHATSPMPDADTLQRVVIEAYEQFKGDMSGKNADYIPYLASVPSELFAVVIVTTDGQMYTAGDTNYAFSIQSCSK